MEELIEKYNDKITELRIDWDEMYEAQYPEALDAIEAEIETLKNVVTDLERLTK